MLKQKQATVRWLEFKIFQEFHNLKHGIILSNEKDSPHFNLNLSPSEATTCKSLKEINSALNLPKPYFLKQVHENRIVTLNSSLAYPTCNADGWSTQDQNKVLWIKHADCQAVIFYDPVQKAIANIHCGWRGSVLNILGQAVYHLKEQHQSHPKNIRVGISPSLGPKSAEFIHYKKELPHSFWDYQIKPTYFDFWEISRNQLIDAGILEEHIEIAKICTYERDDLFFSYRRNRTKLRNATFVYLL